MGSRGIVVAAICGVIVAGCTPPADDAPADKPPAESYDIARLSEILPSFPSGYAPKAYPLSHRNPTATNAGEGIGIAKVDNVDPPQCRSVLIPVADSMGDMVDIYAPGVAGTIWMAAVSSPDPLPADIPAEGCDHINYTRANLETAAVERITAPQIEGARTIAIKYPGAVPSVTIYQYTAILGDRVAVTLRGAEDQGAPATAALPGLLADGVAAVRGTYTPPSRKEPQPGNDITRLVGMEDAMKQAFPPGLDVHSGLPDPGDQETVGRVLGGDTLTNVEPAQCKTALQPIHHDETPLVFRMEGTRSGGQPEVIVYASQSRHLTRAELPASGCDHILVTTEDESPMTIDRVSAPQIDGVTTLGFKIEPGGGRTLYRFAAILDDDAYIDVRSYQDAAAISAEALSRLLEKVVAVVRG